MKSFKQVTRQLRHLFFSPSPSPSKNRLNLLLNGNTLSAMRTILVCTRTLHDPANKSDSKMCVRLAHLPFHCRIRTANHLPFYSRASRRQVAGDVRGPTFRLAQS